MVRTDSRRVELEDYFLVSIQTAGRGRIVQDGRVAELSPGDFALYDSTRPYELIFDESFQQHVLQLPGAVLRSRLRHTEKLTARKVCGDRSAGHLMIGMINTLAANIDTLEAGSVAAIAESVENILVAGLCSLPGAADPVVSRLTAFIATRSRLMPCSICATRGSRWLRSPRICGCRRARFIALLPARLVLRILGSGISGWTAPSAISAIRRSPIVRSPTSRSDGDSTTPRYPAIARLPAHHNPPSSSRHRDSTAALPSTA